jgi:hypothetical protein
VDSSTYPVRFIVSWSGADFCRVVHRADSLAGPDIPFVDFVLYRRYPAFPGLPGPWSFAASWSFAGRVEVTDQTRPLYRELVEAGMMIPLHSFARGAEGAYRLAEAACSLRDALRDGLTSPAVPAPSA